MTKTEELKQAIQAGDWKTSLRIASGFRLGLTAKQRNILRTGYECMVHPRTYTQLKVDVQGAQEAAKALLLELYPTTQGV